MTAIITDVLKKNLIQNVYNDILDSTQTYFIGIGRSEDWDSLDQAPTPMNSYEEVFKARASLQSVKRTTDVTYAIPRVNWSSGSIYSAWNDAQVDHPSQPYYVMNENNQVYICIQQGKNSNGVAVTSTIQPSGSLVTNFKTSDGYVWKFLYSLSPVSTNTFLSANFFPVTNTISIDSSSTATEVEQFNVKSNAIAGQIVGVDIITSGTGYTSAPTITFSGDGTSASATGTVVNGELVKVDMDNESSALGSGYSFGNVEISGGGATTQATLRPIFAPQGGFGYNPLNDLKVNSIMLVTKPAGTENGDFIVDNSFRQITLMKNLKKYNDSDFTDLTGSALKSVKLGTVSSPFSLNKTFTGSISGATAHIDDIDSVYIYYHQNNDTGFKSFQEGENILENNGSGLGILDSSGIDLDSNAYVTGDFNPFSGEVLYISNKAAIERSASQTEDLKILIQI